jgi:hypothetical protein
LLAPLDLDIHSGYISHEFLTFEPRAEKMKPIKTSLLARVSLSWYSKLRFKSDPFSFGRKVEESQKVLICMPSDVDGFTMARDLLADFIRIFRPREVYVLVPFLEGGVYLSDSSDYRVVVVDRNDLDFFSLPRKGFVQKLTQLGFGISLDLDLENGFFSRFLCLKCGIPLRIGPKEKGAFPLYNVQLALAQNQPGPREAYERMARTLKSLISVGNKSTPSKA